jgi:hypothetical protein
MNWLPLSLTSCGLAPLCSSARWITRRMSAARIEVSSSRWTT